MHPKMAARGIQARNALLWESLFKYENIRQLIIQPRPGT